MKKDKIRIIWIAFIWTPLLYVLNLTKDEGPLLSAWIVLAIWFFAAFVALLTAYSTSQLIHRITIVIHNVLLLFFTTLVVREYFGFLPTVWSFWDVISVCVLVSITFISISLVRSNQKSLERRLNSAKKRGITEEMFFAEIEAESKAKQAQAAGFESFKEFEKHKEKEKEERIATKAKEKEERIATKAKEKEELKAWKKWRKKFKKYEGWGYCKWCSLPRETMKMIGERKAITTYKYANKDGSKDHRMKDNPKSNTGHKSVWRCSSCEAVTVFQHRFNTTNADTGVRKLTLQSEGSGDENSSLLYHLRQQ